MRNLILFIAILVSSLSNAQTFDFSCSPDYFLQNSVENWLPEFDPINNEDHRSNFIQTGTDIYGKEGTRNVIVEVGNPRPIVRLENGDALNPFQSYGSLDVNEDGDLNDTYTIQSSTVTATYEAFQEGTFSYYGGLVGAVDVVDISTALVTADSNFGSGQGDIGYQIDVSAESGRRPDGSAYYVRYRFSLNEGTPTGTVKLKLEQDGDVKEYLTVSFVNGAFQNGTSVLEGLSGFDSRVDVRRAFRAVIYRVDGARIATVSNDEGTIFTTFGGTEVEIARFDL